MHKMPYLNGSLLRLVILIPDELQELKGAGFGGPHAPHGLMILHFFSNLSQQPRLQNVLGHLWQSLLSSTSTEALSLHLQRFHQPCFDDISSELLFGASAEQLETRCMKGVVMSGTGRVPLEQRTCLSWCLHLQSAPGPTEDRRENLDEVWGKTNSRLPRFCLLHTLSAWQKLNHHVTPHPGK